MYVHTHTHTHTYTHTHARTHTYVNIPGNLLAVTAVVEEMLVAKEKSPILILLTDLNVCRAVNGAACPPGSDWSKFVGRELLGREALEGLSSSPPHPALASALASMERVVGALVHAGGQILASFDPHRCCPDGVGQPHDMGQERVNAVCAGCVVLYPSANPRRPGCVEVREPPINICIHTCTYVHTRACMCHTYVYV
jgi:hypothetical protein